MAFLSLLQRWHQVPTLQGTCPFPSPGKASPRIPGGSAHMLLTWRIQGWKVLGWNGAKSKAAPLSQPVEGVQMQSQLSLSFPAAPSNLDPDPKESWAVPSCFARI